MRIAHFDGICKIYALSPLDSNLGKQTEVSAQHVTQICVVHAGRVHFAMIVFWPHLINIAAAKARERRSPSPKCENYTPKA